MPRFYVPFPDAEVGKPIVLPSESVHHAMRVLRLRQDDKVEVFNGRGLCAKGPIHFAADYAEVVPEEIKQSERGLRLILLQSLVSNEKMDWIVEKACELGYSKIVVFPADRSEIRLTSEKAAKRLERWNKIAVSACKQCGEYFLPEIVFKSSLKSAAEEAEGLRIMLSPSAQTRSEDEEIRAVTFAVGPEGGFSDGEMNTLLGAGFTGKRLGARVLRTETAAIAAASYAQTLWGDFNYP